MSSPVTATTNSILPEELEAIKEIQQNYSLLTRRYGELHFQKKFIDEEMISIDEEMGILEGNRAELMATLQEKYGAGSIDVNTGSFIPASAPPTV